MDSINFDTFDSPAGGVELSDTLSSWRKKTNGIITKISTEATALTDVQGKVNNIIDGDGDVLLSKIEEVSDNKLLGNVSGNTGDVSQVEIDVTASGLQDSDDTIPTSKAVKDHIDKRYISGRINANGTAASLHGITVSRVEAGVYNVIVADSHQLPSGESYSVVTQIGADVAPFTNVVPPINSASPDVITTGSFNIHVFKINDIGGDPAYRVEIFESKSGNLFSDGEIYGGDDNQIIARFSLLRVDAPFSVIGLPASTPS